MEFTLAIAGDSVVDVVFSAESPVPSAVELLRRADIPGIRELQVCPRCITVFYSPIQIGFDELCGRLGQLFMEAGLKWA